MENMDKGLTVPKWVLIVPLKIPQMPQNLSAQFVCPSPKVLDFSEKRLHWASVVCGKKYCHMGRKGMTFLLGKRLKNLPVKTLIIIKKVSNPT